MIVRPRPSIFTLLVSMKGSIVPAITPKIIVAALWACVAAIIREEFSESPTDKATFVTFTPFTALGVAISLFLGFRNNACYDRWWEGRKLWGKQLIEVRNVARLLDVSGLPHDVRRTVARLTVAHSHQLRAQLRQDTDAAITASDHLTSAEIQATGSLRNRADGILRLAATAVREAQRMGQIDSYWAVALTSGLNELGQVQGACERISNTPLPFPYSLLVGRTASMYIFLAPFAMASDLGWWTILFNAVLAYTFFGLDELASQLENPFEARDLALALGAICRLIEISVAEALGDVSPPPLEPVNYLLM